MAHGQLTLLYGEGLAHTSRQKRCPHRGFPAPALSVYGAKRAQPVATGRKWEDLENGSNRPIGNRWQPTATVSERMVKRGSTSHLLRLVLDSREDLRDPEYIPPVRYPGNRPSRTDPARGSRKLPQAPANPRNTTVGKPCSRRESPPIPAQPGSHMTGLSRRRSRVRVPSLPFLKVPANRRLLLPAKAANADSATRLPHT